MAGAVAKDHPGVNVTRGWRSRRLRFACEDVFRYYTGARNLDKRGKAMKRLSHSGYARYTLINLVGLGLSWRTGKRLIQREGERA